MIACDCHKLESIHPSITIGCYQQFKGRPTRPMCKNQNDTAANCRQRPCTGASSQWPDSMDLELVALYLIKSFANSNLAIMEREQPSHHGTFVKLGQLGVWMD